MHDVDLKEIKMEKKTRKKREKKRKRNNIIMDFIMKP